MEELYLELPALAEDAIFFYKIAYMQIPMLISKQRALYSTHAFKIVPDDQNKALYSTHAFKILFKEGGCGTFVPLFFNLIKSVRQYSQQYASREEQRADPLQAVQTPVDEMMRHA
ncbi:hypothetical protein CsSME_00030906 [Camellia sinensis var. sinensis]